MYVINTIVSIFFHFGLFVFACVVLAAAAAASAWCFGFFGSVCAVGLFRTTEGKGAARCAPYGGAVGALLTLWTMLSVGIGSAIFCAIGFCAITLLATGVTFLLFPPPPLPFGDDGLC